MVGICDYAWGLPSATVRFSVSSATDRGLVRQVNEDSYVDTPPIFAVADGMGGHAFGDRASQATARALTALASAQPAAVVNVLEAISAASVAVRAISQDELAGTTLAGVALVQDSPDRAPHWLVFNIGDSRVYGWNGLVLTQISLDHSAVQELVDDGTISAEQAASHPQRNVITRAIGIDGDREPDVWLLPAGGEQTFVICSDGLTKEMDDRAIESVLAVASDVPVADRLVAAALASGGSDNVTVVVVRSTVVPTSRGDASGSSPRDLPAHLEVTHPRR